MVHEMTLQNTHVMSLQLVGSQNLQIVCNA